MGHHNILLGSKPDWRESLFKYPAPDDIVVLRPDFSAAVAEDRGTDYVLPFLARDYDVLRPSPVALRKSLVPDAEVVALAEDKLAFNKWLIANGFADYVPPLLERGDLSFPLIRKIRVGEWGNGCEIIRDETDLPADDDDAHFLQAYVSGASEFVAHTISLGGRVLFALSYENFYDTDIFVKGVSKPEQSVKRMKAYLHPVIAAILLKLKYTGCACFNYKLVDGKPMIFEMNARIGGSFQHYPYHHLRAYIAAVDAQNSVAAYAVLRTGRLVRSIRPRLGRQ